MVQYTEDSQLSPAWNDPSVRTKPWRRDMRYGAWNVRSLDKSDSLTAVARELARYRFDLVGVQEVRWDKGGHCKSRGL